MNKKRIFLFFFGICVAACIAFIVTTHTKKSEAPVISHAEAAMTVTETEAHKEEWPKIIEASGPVAAWQEAIVGAEISGQRLTEVLVDVGDQVTKGQVLAKFNPDTLLAQQAELKANLVKAEADRDRALLLQKSHALSAQQIETYINTAAVAKARLDEASLQLQYATVTAPDDGVISARNATLGAVGTSGQELFRLIRQNRLEWRGQLNAAQLAQVKPDQKVEITLPDASKAEATVRQIAPSLDPQTRLATIYADIKAGSNARAGMYGIGHITLAQDEVLSVPASSVVIRDGRSYVFKLQAENQTIKVLQIPVIAGDSRDGKTEIVSGLAEGDRLVVKGAGFLNDGDIVRLPEAEGNKS